MIVFFCTHWLWKMQNLNKGDGNWFGPDDELPEEDRQLCEKLALRELYDTDGFNLTKNLEIDDELLQVPGQMVAFVSFVGPYEFLRAKHPTFQFNIMGAAANPEGAMRRLKKNTDHRYDIYTLGMYEWVAIPPNRKFMEDQQAHEEFLNSVIVRHRKEILLRKHLFEFRKTRIMQSRKVQEPMVHKGPVEIEELPQSTVVTPVIPEEPSLEGVPEIPEVPMDPPSRVQTSWDTAEEFDATERLEQLGLRSQAWVVLSLVGTLATGMALKVQGFYETQEAARKVLDRIRQIDDTFETYIAEAGRWLPAEHNVEDIEDQVFQNEYLTELYRNHAEENRKAVDFEKSHKHLPVARSAPEITEISENLRPTEILDGLSEDVSKTSL